MTPPVTYVALVHHPVLNRNRRVVTSAITNLDLHDIARSCRTFGVAGYFVVTPVAAQRELARRIADHWVAGEGREQNGLRAEAVALLEVAADIAEVVAAVHAREGAAPLCVATAARAVPGPTGAGPVEFAAVPAFCAAHPTRPLLLLFGTGWGLTSDVIAATDALLPPIARAVPPKDPAEYNHLSVRSAVAIVLDRLFGEGCPWLLTGHAEPASKT